MAGTAGAAGFTDDRQHDVFGGDAGSGVAGNLDFHGFGAALFQGLGRQHMLYFRGADAERQRAERAVGGGVGVAADDGHPRQRHALFRSDNMHDALKRVVQVIQLHAELGAVLDQFLHLDAGHLAAGVDVAGLGGHVMVHGGEGLARLADFAAHGAQAVERLRRRHFMHQMTVDIQQRGFIRRFVHQVRVEQLLI